MNYGQSQVGIDQIYYENDLAYKVSDDGLFTGIVEKRKRNGKLTHSIEFYNGVIQIQKVYYRNPKKGVSSKIVYDPDNPFVEMVKIRYFQGVKETRYFNDGKKILLEQERNGKVFYSCDYSGKKKHGFERCMNDDGTKTVTEYQNGKKIKTTSPQ